MAPCHLSGPRTSTIGIAMRAAVAGRDPRYPRGPAAVAATRRHIGRACLPRESRGHRRASARRGRGGRGHTAGARRSAARRSPAPRPHGALWSRRATTTTAPDDRRGARVARIAGPARPAIRVARVIRAGRGGRRVQPHLHTALPVPRHVRGVPTRSRRGAGDGRPRIRKGTPATHSRCPLHVVPDIPVVLGATDQAV